MTTCIRCRRISQGCTAHQEFTNREHHFDPYTGSIGYNTSKAMADILAPMLGTTKHHVKNSHDLAVFMKDFTIADDEKFVSDDVSSSPKRRYWKHWSTSRMNSPRVSL